LVETNRAAASPTDKGVEALRAIDRNRRDRQT
jgi:hypothetical protein